MIEEPSRLHLFDIFLLVFQTSQPIKHVQGCDIFLLVFQTFRLVLELKTKRVEVKKRKKVQYFI